MVHFPRLEHSMTNEQSPQELRASLALPTHCSCGIPLTASGFGNQELHNGLGWSKKDQQIQKFHGKGREQPCNTVQDATMRLE